METSLRRLYVGGISPLVTKEELADRFGKFGKIDDVDIIYRKDDQGNHIKTFAYLNVNISDVELKKCISVLNKTKWKGGILQIEMAKESCLHRLSREREDAKEKAKAIAQKSSTNELVLSLEKAGVTDFQMKSAVPGTEVPNHKNWVVSKFGRVLPVLHLNEKKQSKIMKYDPSKYCHNIKKIDDSFEPLPVSQLTWQMEGGDDEISRKRRGEFPNLMPPSKKKLINLPKGDANNIQMVQRIPLASGKTAERLSGTKTPIHGKKPGHLPNRSINSTSEDDSEEEFQAILKRESATIGAFNYVEDSNIEVVDDSFELSYTTHWAKTKCSPKKNSTSNTLDDDAYDSADTDEIITVAKTVQKSCDSSKIEAETVRSDKFSELNNLIQTSEDESIHTNGTKDKSTETKMSKSESDSEIGASEDDSSDGYSDEEYNAMMQNCFRLNLTMGDLETLAKEASEFDDDADSDETDNDDEHDTDIVNAKQNYSIVENPPVPGKKQGAGQASAAIKKTLRTENMQVLESGRKSNCDESDNSDSDLDDHYEAVNKVCSKQGVKIEAKGRSPTASQQQKSPTASQSLVNNHEQGIGAKGQKGEVNKSKVENESNNKKKRGIEPEDIVASILEDDSSSGQQLDRKRKKDSPVKPPAFRGLSSLLASAATVKSPSSSSMVSNVKTAAVTTINNCLNGNSCTGKQEKQVAPRDLKQIFLEAKSKSGSSSSDTSEECNSDLSAASSNCKPAISQIGTTKEHITPKVKQEQDNQKRLAAMMERRKECELQKQIIQGALQQLDSQSSIKSKHIVFNSESESEKEEEASTSEKKINYTDQKAKEGTSKLFDSSEEDSDYEDKIDDARFEVKAQYEGRSGMKLMELQSRFGTDERFKMDSRFLESSSDDEELSEAKISKEDEECDLSVEKKKNLDILQSILNIKVDPQPESRQTAKKKKFKDLNALHYDPTKDDNETFDSKTEEKKEKKESKSERTKKRLEAEKLPVVSKETYHEIIMDFKEVFATSKPQSTKEPETSWDQEVEPEKKEVENATSSDLVSFKNKSTEGSEEFSFSFFGNTTEETTSNNETYKTETIKPAKVAWQDDPRFQDSSSEGEDDDTEGNLTTEKKTSTRPDISTIRFFFFVKDDERLKTGPTMFCRSSNKEGEVWEQRQDILLEECRKRHKDAKRKTKVKN